MSIIIGVTGPTGSGKSSLWDTARAAGFKVIDCDAVARSATEKGTNGLRALSEAFSDEILNADGSLNRKELARRAFKSREDTELLNKTILPFIAELVKNQADAERVLLDAPTLFESGINKICNKTVAILADKDLRLERIMSRDSIDRESALLRISAGKDDGFYKQNADYIIYNNGKIEVFTSQFKQIIDNILEGSR